jgi:hypothetical protein
MNSGSSGVALAQKSPVLAGRLLSSLSAFISFYQLLSAFISFYQLLSAFISFYQLISEAGEYNPPGTTPKRLRPFLNSPSRDFA